MDGLMKVGMRNRLERQHFAMNILLNTYGSDLTTLKASNLTHKRHCIARCCPPLREWLVLQLRILLP